MNDWQERNAPINRNFKLFLTGGEVKVLAELLLWGFPKHCSPAGKVQQQIAKSAFDSA
ncbi:hypothetical protein [Gemmiger formicilis]|jgi:hypothetical protein|uniref:hypothetical protein n=1 Tax=Gemmiger formicilis TaxID=745368 RepID=UPI003522BDF3